SQERLRIESGIDLGEPDDAADQQAGEDQQHQRDGDFANRQSATQPRPPRAGNRRTATALFQRFVEVGLRNLKRRRQAEEDSRQQRNRQRETERPFVDADFAYAGDVRRGKGDQQIDCPKSQQDSEDPARQRQQYAFGQQLPDDVSAACTHRRPNRDLLLPGQGG